MNKPKKPATPEPDVKKKLLILGVLCSVVAVVLVYQYFVTSAIPAPAADTDQAKNGRIPWDQLDQSGSSQPQQKPQATSNEQPEPVPGLLDMNGLARKASDISVGRNLFEYPPPPPPKPTPTPPPPTIQLTSISPSSVYARTAPFEVVVNGSNFSLDMRLYLNGNPNFAQTILVNDHQIKATVPQSYFSNQGMLRFEIKKPGQEQAFFSNVLQIPVAEPKNPNSLFKMIGHFTDRDGNPNAVLSESDTKPTSTAKVGDVIFTNWKVVSISKGNMELEDVKEALGVRWPVKMKDEISSGGVASVTPANLYQNTAYTQAEQYNQNYDPSQEQNVIDLNQAMGNTSSNPRAILGQTDDDIKRQQEQFKKMNQMLLQQRQEILKQRQQQIQQMNGITPR
jgi:hypothetical protein